MKSALRFFSWFTVLLWLLHGVGCASSQQKMQQQQQQQENLNANEQNENEDDENSDDEDENENNANYEDENEDNTDLGENEGSTDGSLNGSGGNASLTGNGGNGASQGNMGLGNQAINNAANIAMNNGNLGNQGTLEQGAFENNFTVNAPNINEMPTNNLNANPATMVNNTGVNAGVTNAVPVNPVPVNPVPMNEAPAVPEAAPVAVALPLTTDVYATAARLRWVGYNFDEVQKALKVEIITEGEPEYELFQETNRAGQPEIVVRFHETELRSKVRRPLDASEFHSPVAYVRMREKPEYRATDVVLTLRDKVKPLLFANKGNVQLTFSIPEYYFGNDAQSVAHQIGEATQLAQADILPQVDASGRQPRAPGIPADPAVQAAPMDGGQPVDIPEAVPVDGVLPDNFDMTGAPANAAPANGAPANESANDIGGGFGAFNSAPSKGGSSNVNVTEPEPTLDNTIQPTSTPDNEAIDFEEGGNYLNEHFVPAADEVLGLFDIEERSLSAVAQDNMGFEEDPLMNNAGKGANSNNGGNGGNQGNNAGNNQGNNQSNNNSNNNNNANGNTNGALNNGGNAGNAGGNLGANSGMGNNMAPANNAGMNAPVNNMMPANAPMNNVPMNNAPMNAPMNNTTSANAAPVNNVPMNMNEAPMNAPPMNSEPVPMETVGTEMEGAPMGGGVGGRPVSIDFHKAPLSLVLKTFGEESGNNFVYPPEVANLEITIHLKQVPWDEALKGILETYGLGMVQVGGNMVRIDRLARMNEYLKDLNSVRQYRVQLEPTRILVFRLSHGNAKDVAPQITELLKAEVAADVRTKVTADERTNSIVAEATPNVLSKVKDVVERLDLETPQIRILSRIVEVQKSAQNFLGVVWNNSVNFDPGRGLGFGSLPFPNSVNSDFVVDPGVNATPTAGNLTMRFGSLNKFLDLDLLLKMEEKKGTTNVLQNHNVLVLDRQPAKIMAGSSMFFRPAAGGTVINSGGAGAGQQQQQQANQTGLAQVDFNLSLEVVPQVTAAGNINLKLAIDSETPGDPVGDQLANKNARHLDTFMSRRSGETAVIGGIYDTKRQKSTTGIPILSDLPIVGALFRSTRTVDQQTELLIMITPTLVGQSDNAETAYQDGFSSGSSGDGGAAEDFEADGELENNAGGQQAGPSNNISNNGGGNNGGNTTNAGNNLGGNSGNMNF